MKTDVDDIPLNTYATTDLPFAAFLRCRGISLKAIRREGPKSTFYFEDEAYCFELGQRWANEEDVEVSATVYSRELAKIKTLAVRGGF